MLWYPLITFAVLANYGHIWFAFCWWIINVALHFIVDLITSKITSKFWEEKNMRFFFVMIGFDQLIHALLFDHYVFSIEGNDTVNGVAYILTT